MGSSESSRGSISRILEHIPSSVSNDELEDYVASLIVQQSRQRTEKYEREGIGAYLDDQRGSSNTRKAASTNKNFLASVIRNVEGHNSALLRQQIVDTQRAARNQRRRNLPDDSASSSNLSEAKPSSFERSRSQRNPEDDQYSTKMDKYFSKTYDPALDISVDDLTDGRTGLIAADAGPSTPAWDRMLSTLESKNSDASEKEAKRQRKEERDRVRALRARRRDSRERDRSRSPSHKHSRRETRHSPSTSHRREVQEDEKHRDKRRRHSERVPLQSPAQATPKPKTREWDLGKNLSF